MKKIIIIRQIAIEGPGTFGKFLRKKNIEYTLLDVFRENGAVLAKQDLKTVAAVVILGGPMNVYEDEKFPFLTVEKDFIRKVIEEKVPLLGICLGAQLIACVLGAKVRRALCKEIGWYDVPLEKAAKSDPLMKGLDGKMIVFQWHEDTFDLPKGALLLAKNNGMNQAFRFGDFVWGFQFHIEVDEKMIASWRAEYAQECSAAAPGHDFKKQSESIYGAFSDLCATKKKRQR
ncbi:MAG: type 1 glutamine amidotransferase [Candidatus Omnitrophota bacterium]